MTADPCSGAETGAGVVDIARGWIGTPYCHQASLRGVGCDCLGLLRGVWRELHGAEPESCPAYSPSWSEYLGGEVLWDAASRHLAPVEAVSARPGDVLLFRMARGGPAKHLGILSSGSVAAGWMIHACSGHAVFEAALTQSWRRRLVACFRIPEREN